jgi:hypothetical protein
MKKVYLLLLCLIALLPVQAQEIKGETIIVLKGGITVIRFADDVVNFRVGDKEDYNINVEEGSSIRIWAKNGVSNPKTTNLIVTEGKRNHMFTLQYKEKGDFNSTYYDFSNLKALKKKLAEKPTGEATASIPEPEPEVEAPKAEEKPVTSKKKEKEEKALAEKKAQEEKAQALAKEQERQAALQRQIDEEKRKQAALESQLANAQKERAEKERKLALEKQAKEEKASEEAARKKQQQEELKNQQQAQYAAQQERMAAEKKEKDEKAKKLAIQQKEEQELNAKLAAEKKQREALERKLAEERFKSEQHDKELALETAKRKQREEALAKEQAAREAKEQKLAAERQKREETERKLAEEKRRKEEADRLAKEELAKYVPPPVEYDIHKEFPNINFKEPPAGQYYESNYFVDTSAYYKASQVYLSQPENNSYKNAGTEIDGVRIELSNINFSGKAAYVRFKIENKTNHYFLLGATMLKILEAESGKKYQLNPYYISSFPILKAGESAYVVYAMKPEQNISPDSFVMMSIRERQTNKKFELNFPGNFYTDALKAAK